MRTITMHWNILSKMRYTTCIVCFLCLRFQQKNYVRRSCNYDRLILSWLTYYFQSSLLSLLSIVNIQSPSRQNVDVFWDFEFSWRLLLSLSSSSSSSSRRARASSGIHDPITPPIAILQQSREVVWKASSISTGLVDVGDCRVIVCVLTENGS